MRTIFKRRSFIALIAILLPAGLSAQEEPPKVGFIRLVNAVGAGTGNVHLKIDGQDRYPKGYKLGERTGGIGLAPGAKKIAISKDGVEEGTTTFTVEQGETVSLIAFSEKIPADKDKPEHWAIKILRLKQRDTENSFRLTVLSMCDEPETIFSYQREADKEKTMSSVKRLMTTTIELGKSAGDVNLYARDKETLLSFFRPDMKGNYVVMFYNDAEGAVKAIFFYDPKFVVAG
ncbi:hypothetical protein [Luteolibacter sp. Populi]|uniref:hypothetical protein n=1 Tax=Luteolibacter sp. Populi TaxID=3230487 RepID=UPI003465CC91